MKLYCTKLTNNVDLVILTVELGFCNSKKARIRFDVNFPSPNPVKELFSLLTHSQIKQKYN